MIPRSAKEKLLRFSSIFPVVSVVGPRQSGKTTLVRATFPDYRYVTLEDLDVRAYAKEDPRGFLSTYRREGSAIIIDEAQYVPELFSYIQTIVDQEDQPGQFILTGSQNFLMDQQLSQTLAGRVAILTLLPLTINELHQHLGAGDLEQWMWKGSYPRVHQRGMLPSEWYPSYIRTYVERDVRNVINVQDLVQFQRFMKLCAGRTGQVLNTAELGRDCGVSHHTVKSWLSLLAASYLIFLLPPFYNNFSKRVIKSPKLYFFDTGLVCSLLGIADAGQLDAHFLRGGIFESFVISEIVKRRCNRGLEPNCYYWRDQAGHEVDCLIDNGSTVIPVEIKSSHTAASKWLSQLDFWSKLAGESTSSPLVIYAGEQEQEREKGRIVSWRAIPSIEEFLSGS